MGSVADDIAFEPRFSFSEVFPNFHYLIQSK